MNTRNLSLTLVLMLLATIAFAQTRKIGHRSHSGSPTTFAMMLGDDYLGDPPNKAFVPPMRLPIYRVDPFIARVRKHYEEIAKQPAPIEMPQTELPKSENISEPTPSQNQPKSGTIAPKTRPKPGPRKADIPKLAVIPAPDFLVKAPSMPAASAIGSSDTKQESSFWMLIVLLGIPIAPVVFVASAIWSRQEKRA